MEVLGFVTLVVTGFTSGTEFGSFALVHPMIRELPTEQRVQAEIGLLHTFRRVMPLFIPLCPILAAAYALQMHPPGGFAQAVRWSAAVAFTLALIVFVFFLIPINLATGRWDPKNPPADWKEIRDRWDIFHGFRSTLLLIGFVLFCWGVTFKH